MRRLGVALGALGALAVLAPMSACTEDSSPALPPAASASADRGEGPATDRFRVVARTFAIEYSLDATTVESTGVEIPATDGLVARPAPGVAAGSQVAKGARLGRLVADPTEVRALEEVAASSTVAASRLAYLRSQAGPITAPVAGSVVTTSGGLGVKAPGLDVRAGVSPLQQLRIRAVDYEASASVETMFGRRDVPCQAQWLSSGAGAAASDASGGDAGVKGVRIRPVPPAGRHRIGARPAGGPQGQLPPAERDQRPERLHRLRCQDRRLLRAARGR